MVLWEFYLQKRGDRSWLLLEGATEVIAGEYRLAVRSQYKEAIVTVQIDYLPSTEEQPSQQSEFYQRTNQEGLLLVMPFRELSAGRWIITCEIPGLNFTPRVQLVVLPEQPVTHTEHLLHLSQREFLVADNWHIDLPLLLEGAGELAIVLKHPQTLDTVVDVRRYLWQGGKLDLAIELPQRPVVSVLAGTVHFAGQVEHFTVTYPPHLLPPELTWQELPPLTPKVNPYSSTPVFPPEPINTAQLAILENLEEPSGEFTMDAELEKLLQPTPRRPRGAPRPGRAGRG
ncbi:MAG: hypothetical protein ACK4QL_02910, partial [Pseudanabaenaceae cyanobacterium]